MPYYPPTGDASTSVSPYSLLGNSGSATAPGASVNTLILGTPGFALSGSTVAAQITNAAATYVEFDLQNTTAGAGASTDFVVNADNATNTTHYGNFGINSSVYTGSGSFNLAGATYLTATTGDLAIGTTTSNAIHFVVNNGATDAMTIGTGGTITYGGNFAGAFGTTGVSLVGNAYTQTDSTTGAGTVATAYGSLIGANTFATAANAITITDGYNIYFKNPVAGSHITLSNAHAFGADSGQINGTIGATTFVQLSDNGRLTTGGFFAGSTQGYAWTSAGSGGTADTFLTRNAAAMIQFGQADAASPIAQAARVQSVVGGTSNANGANWTQIASLATGSGTPGDYIIQTGFQGIASTGTVTFSNGSANITYTSAMAVNQAVQFTTTGALPTNFATATTYYVVSNSGTVLTVSATVGGSAIVAGSAGSGTQTILTATVQQPAITAFTVKGGTQQLQLTNGLTSGNVTIGTNAFDINSTTGLIRLGSGDTILTRGGAAATWQLGAADAASPVAQTLQAQSVVAGNANTSGATFTIAGSKSNGSGGGDLVLQTTVSTAGSGIQNTLADGIRIKSGLQSVVIGNAALAANANDGFLYIPTCAGTPTGTPTSNTGRIAMVYDTTNHQFWFYDSGWKQPKTPAGAATVTWQ